MKKDETEPNHLLVFDEYYEFIYNMSLKSIRKKVPYSLVFHFNFAVTCFAISIDLGCIFSRFEVFCVLKAKGKVC